MSEKIVGVTTNAHPDLAGRAVKQEIPAITHRFKRPKDGEDFTWVALHEDPYKPHRRTGWMRVAKFSAENPPENFPPQDRVRTTDEEHPPILTGAQGYAQAREKNED